MAQRKEKKYSMLRKTKEESKGLIKEGRPTKYLPDIIFPKIDKYLSGCGREQTQFPTAEGLALYLGVNTDTLYEWNKVHPQFSDYLKKLSETQKNQLMNDGMYGGKKVNASMAIFLLKAIHHLKEEPNINIAVGVKVVRNENE